MIKSRQAGFTLIELVVVIVILGILAAFAVPRFMGMEGRARIAVVNGMAGSLRSATAMAHGVWLADGLNAASVTIEGVPVRFIRGYPDRRDIQLLIQDSGSFTVTNGVFQSNGVTTACRVTYPNATAAAPIPVVTTTITGCGQ